MDNSQFNIVFDNEKSLTSTDYEQCTFKNCDFSEVSFSDIKFSECKFENCNLSLIKTDNTAFREVEFVECKMLGVRFDYCNSFNLKITFKHCQLQHSSFYQLNLPKTQFHHCQMVGIDFTETTLTSSVFTDCNLDHAIFAQSRLEKVNFKSAYNYSIHPENNKIKGAQFSISGLPGLLQSYKIEIEN